MGRFCKVWEESCAEFSFYMVIHHLHLISGIATSLVPRGTLWHLYYLKLSRATLDLSGARDLVAFCFAISFFFPLLHQHGRNVCAWAGAAGI